METQLYDKASCIRGKQPRCLQQLQVQTDTFVFYCDANSRHGALYLQWWQISYKLSTKRRPNTACIHSPEVPRTHGLTQTESRLGETLAAGGRMGVPDYR